MITFKKVSLKNFMSYGNQPTIFDLNKNDITVHVGTNGSGKSSIIEAIVFALFGKPFRNINKPQLVNATNQKDCVVEIEFVTNGVEYKVIRGLKPVIFEIYADGAMVDQSSKIKDYQKYLEDNILKINYKTFTQVVVLGTATYTPFMELTAAHRRDVVEDLLGIQVFSVMNEIVKEKINNLKEQYAGLSNEEVLRSEKIRLMEKHAEDIRNRSASNIQFIEKEIETQRTVLETKKKERDELQAEVGPIYDFEHDLKKESKAADTLIKLRNSMNSKLAEIDKELSFYRNSHCPTCTQPILNELRVSKEYEKELRRNQLLDGIRKVDDDIAVISSTISELNKKIYSLRGKQVEIIAVEGAIQGINTTISSLSKQLINIKNLKSNEEGVADDEAIKKEKESLGQIIEMKQTVLKSQADYGIMSTLLKDNGIKATIIKQYIPIMNKLINKYLSDLDFFIDFNLTENFSECIKSRNRSDYSYASFSEGEKFKINLALLFTWREIAKIKNSAATNLLFLDEILDSSLDIWGTDAVLKLIHTLKNTNTFIISHKVDVLQDKFTNIFTITKENGFSKIKK